MRFPLSTGEAAQLIGTTEPVLAQAVRLGKVNPAPPIIAGRRLWDASHVLQAAEALGRSTDELRQSVGASRSMVSGTLGSSAS